MHRTRPFVSGGLRAPERGCVPALGVGALQSSCCVRALACRPTGPCPPAGGGGPAAVPGRALPAHPLHQVRAAHVDQEVRLRAAHAGGECVWVRAPLLLRLRARTSSKTLVRTKARPYAQVLCIKHSTEATGAGRAELVVCACTLTAYRYGEACSEHSAASVGPCRLTQLAKACSCGSWLQPRTRSSYCTR